MSYGKRPSESPQLAQLPSKRKKQHQEIELCSHCGDGIETGAGEKTYHKVCKGKHLPKCKEAMAMLKENYPAAERVLLMGINVDFLYGTMEGTNMKQEKKRKRDNKLTELLKNASALRNSDSGFILIQLVGLSPDDSFTGAFDEFADEKLNGLIEDGTMFGDVFKKARLSKLPISGVEVEKYHDCLVLYVAGSNIITTSNFATKVSLDVGIIDPSPSVMIKFMKERKLLSKNLVQGDMSDLNMLQESRETQLKGTDKLQKNETLSLAEQVWTKLRIRDYICAFSKNLSGGSYFLGIGEKKYSLPGCTYLTTENDVHGLSSEACEAIETEIRNRVREQLLVCNFEGDMLSDLEFIDIKTINTKTEGRFVLKVSVKPVKGVVFNNKNGPLAYKVETDKSGEGENSEAENIVVQATVNEWFKGIC